MKRKWRFAGFSVALIILLLYMCSTQKKKEKAEEHYQAGLAYQKAEKVDSSLLEFQQAIKLDPQHVKAHLNYTRLMRWEKNQEEEVITEYQNKIKRHPRNVIYHYVLGKLYDSPQEIKEQADKIIEIDPNSFRGYELLASAFQRDEDYDSAIVTYKKALAIDTTESNLYWGLAYSYSRIDSFDLSNTIFKKVIQLDSTQYSIYDWIWRNTIQKEGNTPAVKEKISREIEALLEKKGDNLPLLSSAVRAYRSIGEQNKVKELEEKILQIDTTGNWSQNVLLNRLYQIRDPQERLNACEKFLAENPASRLKQYVFSIGANIIRDQLKLGDEKSIDWGERWIQECPEDATAYNDLVWTIYQHHEDKLDKALEYMKKAVAVARPYQKNYIMDTLGWIYFKKGMYPEALTTMEETLKLYKDEPSPEVIFHYGAVLAKNGKLEEGLENIVLALSQEEIEEARKSFNELYKEKFGSEQGANDYLIKTIMGKASVEPYAVPTFELTNLNGEKVNFSDYYNKSKVILVAFWMPT